MFGKLALEGYDPVAYFSGQIPTKGEKWLADETGNIAKAEPHRTSSLSRSRVRQRQPFRYRFTDNEARFRRRSISPLNS